MTNNELNNTAPAITVGDRIRAQDFPHGPAHGECFVEGVVDGIDDNGFFVIECTRDVFDGEERASGDDSRVGVMVLVPITMTFDWPERLEKI